MLFLSEKTFQDTPAHVNVGPKPLRVKIDTQIIAVQASMGTKPGTKLSSREQNSSLVLRAAGSQTPKKVDRRDHLTACAFIEGRSLVPRRKMHKHSSARCGWSSLYSLSPPKHTITDWESQTERIKFPNGKVGYALNLLDADAGSVKLGKRVAAERFAVASPHISQKANRHGFSQSVGLVGVGSPVHSGDVASLRNV